MKYFVSTVLIFLPSLVSSYYMKIGIVSYDLSTDTTKKIWSMAQNYSTMMSLEPIVQEVQWREHDSAVDISRAICGLVSIGVDALVFLGPSLGNSFISSYSDYLGLPFVTAVANSDHFGKYQISMLPDTSRAATDFIVHFGWDRFIFFYDSYDGPDQLQKITDSLITLEFVPKVDGFWKTPDVQTAIRCIKELNPDVNRRIVLATSEEFAEKLAKELRTIGSFNILLLNPVGNVQTSPEQIQGGYVNTVTKFSVVESQDPSLVALENRLKTLPSFYTRGRTRKNVPETAIFHYDSSSTLNTMFNDIAREMPSALRSRTNMNCLQYSGEIPETTSYLRKVVIDHGVTGKIKFNQDGQRTDYKLEIISSQNIIKKIGTWSSTLELQLNPNTHRNPFNPTYAALRSDPLLRVTSILVKPFLTLDDNGTLQGFAVDFLHELSKEIKRKFHLRLVEDGRFGSWIPPLEPMRPEGRWTGMIGELIRGEADLAVAPLTKTLYRQKYVDFSKNILENGLNILLKKQDFDPGTWTFQPFSFLTLWSAETWIVLVLAVAIYSAVGYGINRFIGAPDRVRALESKGTDNLSPCGSVWLTVGSLFFRDTGIYPRNLTHRLWALLWWIFCIFISLLYISMLVLALIKTRTTVTTIHSKKTSQQVLKEFLETGVPNIGATMLGSTMDLFVNSQIGAYQQVGRFMEEHPELMVPSYPHGVAKVRESGGKYAFIMESTSSEVTARTYCDTMITSGFLATLSYAVTLPKNSTLKEAIDHGIISLTETGKLRELYEKWWHGEPTNCEDPSLNILPKVYNTSMTLHEVSGLFYLFILFSILSIAAAAIEYYIRTRNITVR